MTPQTQGNQKRQQKQHEQQEKQHTTRETNTKPQRKFAEKNTTKRNKNNTNILENQSKAARVCFLHNKQQEQRGLNRQILSQLVVKKLLLSFGKVNHCENEKGGGLTVGGPKAATNTNCNNRNTSNKKSSNKEQHQSRTTQTTQKLSGGRKSCGRSPNAGVPKGRAPKGGPKPRKSGSPKGGWPKISRFFSLARHYIHSYFLSWVSFSGILVVWLAGTLKCARLEFSGCGPKNKTWTTNCPEEQSHWPIYQGWFA